MKYLLRLGRSFARLHVRLCHQSVYSRHTNACRVGVDLGEKWVDFPSFPFSSMNCEIKRTVQCHWQFRVLCSCCFCRKLEISSGRFARFADGSAVVQVQKSSLICLCPFFLLLCALFLFLLLFTTNPPSVVVSHYTADTTLLAEDLYYRIVKHGPSACRESSLMYRNPTKKKILSTDSSQSVSLALCPVSLLPRTCQHSTAEPILRLVLLMFICSTCNSPLWLLIKTEHTWLVIF